MVDTRKLPQVGRNVLLEGLGEFFCAEERNGSMAFLGREGEAMVRYTVQKIGLRVGVEGYVVNEDFANREILGKSSHGYTQAVDLLRRAKL